MIHFCIYYLRTANTALSVLLSLSHINLYLKFRQIFAMNQPKDRKRLSAACIFKAYSHSHPDLTHLCLSQPSPHILTEYRPLLN